MPRWHLGLADKMTDHAGGNNYIIAFAHVLVGRTPPYGSHDKLLVF